MNYGTIKFSSVLHHLLMKRRFNRKFILNIMTITFMLDRKMDYPFTHLMSKKKGIKNYHVEVIF